MNKTLIEALADHLALPETVSLYDINFAFGAVSLIIRQLKVDVDERSALIKLLGTTQEIALWALNSEEQQAVNGLRDGIFYAAELLENDQLRVAA